MKIKDEFLKRYGGISFDKVRFRPGVAFTTGFGLDNTFNEFRIHNAIDRGNRGPNPKSNPIYCPFECTPVWHSEYSGGFGSMLQLKTEYGFEVRIMHMVDVSDYVKEAIENKKTLEPGTLLGYAGNKGVGTAAHTHVEVVSYEKTCELLDAVLLDKYRSEVVQQEVTLKDAISFMHDKNVADPELPAAAWHREITKRGISALYKFHCYRLDYHDGQLKTFYSSQALFGM